MFLLVLKVRDLFLRIKTITQYNMTFNRYHQDNCVTCLLHINMHAISPNVIVLNNQNVTTLLYGTLLGIFLYSFPFWYLLKRGKLHHCCKLISCNGKNVTILLFNQPLKTLTNCASLLIRMILYHICTILYHTILVAKDMN